MHKNNNHNKFNEQIHHNNNNVFKRPRTIACHHHNRRKNFMVNKSIANTTEQKEPHCWHRYVACLFCELYRYTSERKKKWLHPLNPKSMRNSRMIAYGQIPKTINAALINFFANNISHIWMLFFLCDPCP